MTGLYTDESPGLKVDPVVVLVLSLGFIFSVVALHSGFPSSISTLSHSLLSPSLFRFTSILLLFPTPSLRPPHLPSTPRTPSLTNAASTNPVIAKITRRYAS